MSDTPVGFISQFVNSFNGRINTHLNSLIIIINNILAVNVEYLYFTYCVEQYIRYLNYYSATLVHTMNSGESLAEKYKFDYMIDYLLRYLVIVEKHHADQYESMMNKSTYIFKCRFGTYDCSLEELSARLRVNYPDGYDLHAEYSFPDLIAYCYGLESKDNEYRGLIIQIFSLFQKQCQSYGSQISSINVEKMRILCENFAWHSIFLYLVSQFYRQDDFSDMIDFGSTMLTILLDNYYKIISTDQECYEDIFVGMSNIYEFAKYVFRNTGKHEQLNDLTKILGNGMTLESGMKIYKLVRIMLFRRQPVNEKINIPSRNYDRYTENIEDVGKVSRRPNPYDILDRFLT